MDAKETVLRSFGASEGGPRVVVVGRGGGGVPTEGKFRL